jgi:elongation factor G
MLEALADFDDDLMEKLLEDQEPPQEQILRDLRKTLGADQVVPVFLGVAEQDKGVRRLLDALASEAPSRPSARRRWARTGTGRRSSRCSRPTTSPTPASSRSPASGAAASRTG